MTDKELAEMKKRIYESAGVGIEKMMRGDEDAPKAADIAIALRWCDGLGSRGVEESEANEYAQHTMQANAGKPIPDLDLDDYDQATRGSD